MAKFYGKVGYEITTETKPDVHMPLCSERDYFGDVLNLYSLSKPTDSVNEDIELNCEVNIIADPFAFENLKFIKYVVLDNVKWSVRSVTPAYPRLKLKLGGVYHEQD